MGQALFRNLVKSVNRSAVLNPLLSGSSHLSAQSRKLMLPLILYHHGPVPEPFPIHQQVSLVNVSMSISPNHYILCDQHAFNSCYQSPILSVFTILSPLPRVLLKNLQWLSKSLTTVLCSLSYLA